MIQGTMSHAGKSVITAALCRMLSDTGLSVAPFKAQNMALNSHVTSGGGEIGRAQALQAEAARVEPSVDMNPVLLKPTADSACQVIIHGRVHSTMSAAEYHGFKREASRFVRESYARLEKRHDVIVIEGAGSPAEINLRENDLANMGIAAMFSSPVIIVGDIDRGGVFAQIVGTMELISEAERMRVKGFIINKFRGDHALLEPGLDLLEERTQRPVLGVVPYMREINLPEEDSVSLDAVDLAEKTTDADALRAAVVRLPRISNFTDFDPFKLDPRVELRFIDAPEGLKDAEIAVIPGSKNTVDDLLWLMDRGFDKALRALLARGGTLAGICGGLQMLGSRVLDPRGVESSARSAPGLGLLDFETVLTGVKKTFQVKARAACPANEDEKTYELEGYEMHMGEMRPVERIGPFARIVTRNGAGVELDDGAVSADGRVWGTHIHGVFDNDRFREALLRSLRARTDAPASAHAAPGAGLSYRDARERAIERLARTVKESISFDEILGIIGLSGPTLPASVHKARKAGGL